jgi:DNA (cytosine-5)-methyltransferase 1
MKILNLYAGIGGNRKLWGDEHEVTAVECEQYIADVYSALFPRDKIVVDDAHQYLVDHHSEFDFIWSSPPCPTHSVMNNSFKGENRRHLLKYPDMSLYQEIIFLQHHFKGNWIVENVKPYYEPLIEPKVEIDRHYFWSNNWLGRMEYRERTYNLAKATKEKLAAGHQIVLPEGTKDQRKLLRNAVLPDVGLWLFEIANAITPTNKSYEPKQGALL